jgi:homogentisate 1,2-dioxygenase
MTAHGPDSETYRRASEAELKPHKIENALAFMFESRWVIRPTAWADGADHRQVDYDACWEGFAKARVLS